jgi:hypothetical protein
MKRSAFYCANLDVVNNFFSGVLESIPPAQMDLLRYWRRRNWSPIGNWIIWIFFLICVRHIFGIGCLYKNQQAQAAMRAFSKFDVNFRHLTTRLTIVYMCKLRPLGHRDML